MRRLTGLDAGFLYLETGSNHMHVASTAVFDPSTVPGGYSFEKVRSLVENRLPLLPPFRWRLVTVPFALTHPVWVEDPDFDLDYHIRRAALPAPGGELELAEFAADVFSRPLDRNRPLWEMYVIEGLAGGRIGIVTKTHHSAIDGVSGAELTVNLLDITPEPMVVPPEQQTWRPERIPSDIEMVANAVRSLAGQPLAAAKTARRTVESLLNLRRRNRRPGVKPPPAPFTAPRTVLNTAITAHRRVSFARLPLEDVKRIKRAVEGSTVNDVVLAVCAGALRTYLADREELPDQPLVGMVPISVRDEDTKGTMGNQVSSMLVSLATDVADPVERLRTISASTRSSKEQERAISASVLAGWADYLAPAVAARAARLLASTAVTDRIGPLFNVVVSNVPGPDFPLYSSGARLVELYPMGPIADGMALNITVMSYMGTLHVGLVACRETVPDVDDVGKAMDAALQELHAATRG